jgi:hypothetical protein
MNIWIIEFKCHDLLVNNLQYYYVFVYYIDEELSFLVGCPVLKKTLSYRVWVNRITHG